MKSFPRINNVPFRFELSQQGDIEVKSGEIKNGNSFFFVNMVLNLDPEKELFQEKMILACPLLSRKEGKPTIQDYQFFVTKFLPLVIEHAIEIKGEASILSALQ